MKDKARFKWWGYLLLPLVPIGFVLALVVMACAVCVAILTSGVCAVTGWDEPEWAKGIGE